MSGIVLVIATDRTSRSLRKTKVLIEEDRLVRQCGKRQQVILWDKITKVEMRESPKGDVEGIGLHQKHKREVRLAGFNEMGEIARLINGKISDSVLVETKRSKFDSTSPVPATIVIIGVMIVSCILAYVGIEVIKMFAIFFCLCTGAWLLIYRPLGKVNIGDKWFEITCGMLLISLGVLYFIILVVGGKLT
jgi:hypothetical protein